MKCCHSSVTSDPVIKLHPLVTTDGANLSDHERWLKAQGKASSQTTISKVKKKLSCSYKKPRHEG